jgi:hypothetical protein
MTESLTVEQIDSNRRNLLAEFDQRQGLVRDLVRGVACRYATGLYLFGRPGTAKTYTVRRLLEREMKEIYTYHHGHLTPVGLFELLAEHPEQIIVLDDPGTILRSDVALQILLSALEHSTYSDSNRTRVVQYRRKGEAIRVRFSGGIICISNRSLHGADLLGAFKSRVHVLNYDPTDAQLGAFMLESAEKGPQGVMPEEARTIARFVVEEMIRLGCPFDLRLFFSKALPIYRQWADDETESHWQDLVTASIEEHLVAVRHSTDCRPSRADCKEQEHAILREILQQHGTREERAEAWRERTGKSERALYRRLAEIQDAR